MNSLCSQNAAAFCSPLTSSFDEPTSNPNPVKLLVPGSELKENGKAGDVVSELPPQGELPGLKLKQTDDNAEFSNCLNSHSKPYNSGEALPKCKCWG